MPERRNTATLDKADTGCAHHPLRITLKRKFRAPAKFTGRRLEPMLERAAQSRFSADAAHKDDLPAGLKDPGEFVEHRFRIWHRGHDMLRGNHVKRSVRERQALRVHHPEPFDVVQTELFDTLVGLAEHWLGNIDAANLAGL